MMRQRTRSQLRRFDWFKAAVALVLTLLLFVVLVRLPLPETGREAAAPSAPNVGATPPTTSAPPPAETAAASPAAEPAPDDPVTVAPALWSSAALPQAQDGGLLPGLYPFSGVVQPGSRVLLRDGDRTLAATVAGADGSWAFDAALDSTISSLTLEAVAPDGSRTEQYRDNSVAGLTIRWPAPTLRAPNGDAVDDQGTAGIYLLSGSGIPGATVRALVNGVAAGTTTVDEAGVWVVEVTLADPGETALVAGSGAAQSEPLLITVVAALTAPTLETVSGPEDGGPGAYTFSGSAAPGATVAVGLTGEDGSLRSEPVTVAADGAWALTLPLTGGGSYVVSLEAVDEAGGVVTAANVATIPVAEAAGDESAAAGDDESTVVGAGGCGQLNGFVRGDAYIVGPCDNMYVIARELGIDFKQFVALNQTLEDINLIFPGQVLLLPTE